MRLSRLVSITLASALLAALATMGPSRATAAPTPGNGSPIYSLGWVGTQQGHFHGDYGSHQYFGTSVAVSGDTALVGMPYENDYAGLGKVYVFVRSGGAWTYQTTLAASDGVWHDWFGTGVAISGDTAVVGARNHGGTGSAYVFTRSGTTWSQQATLTGDDAGDGAQLGLSTAVEGDTAVVGGGGSAYVFTRSGTTWSQQAKLFAPAEATWFGFSVSLSGDTALVGAKSETVGFNDSQGAAYVFTRSGTTWSPQAKLLASDGNASDDFGYSVALSGDTALVGTAHNAGAAYVFTRSGTTWSPQAKLQDIDWHAYAEFGYSVALDGDTALIGSPWDGGNGTPSAALGAACVFTRSGTTWSEPLKLWADDGAGGDAFGSSVALDGGTALVGSPNDDVGYPVSLIDQGSAYAFLLNSTQPTMLALTTGSTSSLAYGGAFAIKGTLKSGGVGLIGKSMILQSAAPGGSYKDTSYRATTGSGGAFAFSMKPTGKTYYRVRFAGATGYAASGPSTSVYALPKAYASNPVAPTTMYHTRYSTVYGYLKPRHTAGTSPLRIFKYRYVSGKWKSYGYATAKASNYYSYTKCSVSMKLPYTGKWRLRAYALTDTLHAGAWSSGYDYVAVK